MSRTVRLVFSKKEGIKQSWNYPSTRNHCLLCAHRHCMDPTGVRGSKSLNKSKDKRYKLYQKSSMFPEYNLDDEDG